MFYVIEKHPERTSSVCLSVLRFLRWPPQNPTEFPGIGVVLTMSDRVTPSAMTQMNNYLKTRGTKASPVGPPQEASGYPWTTGNYDGNIPVSKFPAGTFSGTFTAEPLPEDYEIGRAHV
jgi:hypothetical protein